jgi:hypothetical protein
MIIPSKHSGYGEGGRLTSTRRVYDSGGGGGASQTQITDLPDWAKPTAQKLLGQTSALTLGLDKEGKPLNPYQQYEGQRTAQFTPLQQQAYGNAYGMDAGPQGFAQNIGTYMSPYQQNVIDREKMEAARASQMLGQEQQARATQAGAFGGYREGIQRAERERGLRSQLQDIQARGSQAAYDRAADQFRSGITQNLAIGQQQAQFGEQQQRTVQQMLDQRYQDFLNEKKYPYQQLEFMSNILRGTPMGGASSLYGGAGSSMGQLTGLGTALAGLFSKAEGGMVDSYAEGGVTDVNNVRSILDKLSDQQLQEAQKAAAARGDTEQLQLIAAEMAQRASMRNGIGAGITDEFADSMEEGMATGGIVAFASGGVDDEYEAVRGRVKEAESKLRTYGLRQRQQDPAGFQAAQTNLQNAQAALDAAERKITGGAAGVMRQSIPAAPAAATPAPTPAPAPVAKAEAAPKKDEPKVQPRAKKEVVAAVKEVAKEAGVPEKTLTEEAMALYNQMQGMRKPELDKLNALIAQQAGRAEEIKGRGLSDALMNFGFTMAAEASKPGARFLESASRAAPEITRTMSENQKAVQAAQDAFNKAQIEQLRSEITGGGENMRTSLTTAQAIMRDRLDQKRMAQDADYRNRSLAMRAAEVGAREPNVYDLARKIMADPKFTGSEREALAEAYAMKTGTAMRAESSARLKYGEAVREIDKRMEVFLAAAKTPAEKAAVQDQIKKAKDSVAQAYGISPGVSTLSPAELSQVQADISKYLNPGK